MWGVFNNKKGTGGGSNPQSLSEVLAVGSNAGGQSITGVGTYNALTLTAQSTGFTISGGTASRTLTVSGNATVSGTNTGDQNLFASIVVAGQTTITPGSTSQALTIVAGSNVSLTTDNTTKTLTISASGGSPALTATQIGYGDGSNLLTGDPNYTYDNVNNVFNVGFSGTPYLSVSPADIKIGSTANVYIDIFQPANYMQFYVGGTSQFIISPSSVATQAGVAFSVGALGGNGAGIVGTDNDGLLNFQQATGWGTPTGTLSRATFDIGSVLTLVQVQQILGAVVTDLLALTAFHL